VRVSARLPTYFPLLAQRKVGKAKGSLLSASLRCASGNQRCSALAPGGKTRCALAALRSDSCRQSDHEVCRLLRQTLPSPVRLGAARRH